MMTLTEIEPSDLEFSAQAPSTLVEARSKRVSRRPSAHSGPHGNRSSLTDATARFYRDHIHRLL